MFQRARNITLSLPPNEQMQRCIEALQPVQTEGLRLPRVKVTTHSGGAPCVHIDEGAFQLPDLERIPHAKARRGNQRLRVQDFISRIVPRIRGIDHIGINGAADLKPLLCALAGKSHLVRYPDALPWYFTLPASAEEYRTGKLVHARKGRGTKFECVYDAQLPYRIIQIDCATDCTREEVESLLPSPIGFTLDGLGDYFRSTYLDVRYRSLYVRIDLRYVAPPHDPWGTGRWLAEHGHRVHARDIESAIHVAPFRCPSRSTW